MNEYMLHICNLASQLSQRISCLFSEDWGHRSPADLFGFYVASRDPDRSRALPTVLCVCLQPLRLNVLMCESPRSFLKHLHCF